jgi:hypothetical protein
MVCILIDWCIVKDLNSFDSAVCNLTDRSLFLISISYPSFVLRLCNGDTLQYVWFSKRVFRVGCLVIDDKNSIKYLISIHENSQQFNFTYLTSFDFQLNNNCCLRICTKTKAKKVLSSVVSLFRGVQVFKFRDDFNSFRCITINSILRFHANLHTLSLNDICYNFFERLLIFIADTDSKLTKCHLEVHEKFALSSIPQVIECINILSSFKIKFVEYSFGTKNILNTILTVVSQENRISVHFLQTEHVDTKTNVLYLDAFFSTFHNINKIGLQMYWARVDRLLVVIAENNPCLVSLSINSFHAVGKFLHPIFQHCKNLKIFCFNAAHGEVQCKHLESLLSLPNNIEKLVLSGIGQLAHCSFDYELTNAILFIIKCNSQLRKVVVERDVDVDVLNDFALDSDLVVASFYSNRII